MDTRTASAIGLIIYVVLTTLISFFMMSRVRKPADYLMAGRGLPFWALTGTITGTCIGITGLDAGESAPYVQSLTVNIKNTSQRDGTETAQLYICQK